VHKLHKVKPQRKRHVPLCIGILHTHTHTKLHTTITWNNTTYFESRANPAGRINVLYRPKIVPLNLQLTQRSRRYVIIPQTQEKSSAKKKKIWKFRTLRT